LRPPSSSSLEGDMTSAMILGSATTGVERSIGAQVTTTSGIAEISSVRILWPIDQWMKWRPSQRRPQGRKHVALDDRA
jgi:hypothetical protein